MRLGILASFVFFLALGVVQSKPGQDKSGPTGTAFKPIEIKGEVIESDANDPKVGKPAKKYTVKLQKDRTYVIDAESKDFDAYLRLLDKAGKQLAEDELGGGAGMMSSRIIHSAAADGEHQIVVATFDGQFGKFALNVREIQIKGEAKPRVVGKTGLEHAGTVAEKDKTDLGKLSKVVSVQVEAGKAYRFEAKSDDFDVELYVFDNKNRLLGHDPDRVFALAGDNGPHHLVVTSFDGKFGKFNVKVHEFALKGEAKPRAVGKDGISITANINAGDKTPLDKLGKVYSVQLKAGQTYTLDLASATMDSYLYLFDSKLQVLAQDDDSGGNLDSRITFTAKTDGVYHIVATTLAGDETGEFTLKVRVGE